MVWAINGTPTTLGSSGDDIDITDLSATNFKVIMSHTIPTGACQNKVTFDNDGGSKYATRNQYNGSTDDTSTSQAYIQQWDGNDNSSRPQFVISYLCNISGEEVLGMYWAMDTGNAGSANAPKRREMVYKFTDTTQILRFDMNNIGAGSYDTSSNVSCIGSD